MTLFDNAGTKIKSWAKALFVIETIAAFISGIVTMVSDDEMFIPGILVMAVGILAAFITSLFLSAFGELVESTTENMYINAKILEKLEQRSPASKPSLSADAARRSAYNGDYMEHIAPRPQPVAPNPEVWYCTACGTENKKNYYQCKKCGKQRTSGN